MKSIASRATQSILVLALATIFCTVLSAQQIPAGDWHAEFQTGGEQIWMQIHWQNPGNTWTWGQTWKVSEVWGLDPNLSIGTHPNVNYEMRRDAGTLTF